MVKEDTFVTILPFMLNELHLSGNRLIVYAIIHGFTMHGDGAWFNGSAAYIAEWCGCSKRTVYGILSELVERGLIERRDKEVNGVHLVDYRCRNCSTPMQKLQHPDEKIAAPPAEKTSHQNIEIDIDRRKDRDIECESVLDYLNERCGRSFRKTDTSLKEIRARLRDGYSAETLKRIVDAKAAEWGGDPKMSKFLRPSTLFRATNCANYEQELGSPVRKVGTSDDFARYEGAKSWGEIFGRMER